MLLAMGGHRALTFLSAARELKALLASTASHSLSMKARFMACIAASVPAFWPAQSWRAFWMSPPAAFANHLMLSDLTKCARIRMRNRDHRSVWAWLITSSRCFCDVKINRLSKSLYFAALLMYFTHSYMVPRPRVAPHVTSTCPFTQGLSLSCVCVYVAWELG